MKSEGEVLWDQTGGFPKGFVFYEGVSWGAGWAFAIVGMAQAIADRYAVRESYRKLFHEQMQLAQAACRLGRQERSLGDAEWTSYITHDAIWYRRAAKLALSRLRRLEQEACGK